MNNSVLAWILKCKFLDEKTDNNFTNVFIIIIQILMSHSRGNLPQIPVKYLRLLPLFNQINGTMFWITHSSNCYQGNLQRWEKTTDNCLAYLTFRSYRLPTNFIHAAFLLGGWMISALFQSSMSCLLSLIKAENPAVFPSTSESLGKDSRKFSLQGLHRDS